MAIGIIFIGESNSQGNALNVHASTAELASGRAAVRIWCNDTNAFANLDVGTNNQGQSAGTPTTHGWELEIANMIDAGQFGSLSASDPAYILKVGVGGTVLFDWEATDTNYTNFESEYALYAAALPAVSDIIVFCSIGINNGLQGSGTTPADYYTQYADFIDRFRVTIDSGVAGSYPTAPVVLTHLMPRFYASYNAEIDRLCRNKTAVYRVLADGLGTITNEDYLHWSYFGLRRQARRLVQTYLAAPAAPAAPTATAITWIDNLNTTTTGSNLTLTSGSTGGARRAAPLSVIGNWIVKWKLDTALKSDEVVVCLHGTNDNNYNYNSGNDYLCGIFQDGDDLYSTTIGGTATNETAVGGYPCWVRLLKAPFGEHVLAQKSSDNTTWTTFKTFSEVLDTRCHGIYVKAFMKGTSGTAEVTDATVEDDYYVAQPTGDIATPLDIDGHVGRLCAEQQLELGRYVNNDVVYLVDGQTRMSDWTNNGTTDRPVLKTAITPTGRAVFRLDGNDDKFSGPVLNGIITGSTLTEATAFIVVKTDADPPPGDTSGGLWQFGSASDYGWYTWPGDSGIYDEFGTTVRKTTGDPTLSLSSAFRIYCVVSASGEWTSRIDGTQHYTTATNTTGFTAIPYVGAGTKFLRGDFADFILYSRKLSATEIGQVEKWLTNEYIYDDLKPQICM